jgi:hypothetical protein
LEEHGPSIVDGSGDAKSAPLWTDETRTDVSYNSLLDGHLPPNSPNQ